MPLPRPSPLAPCLALALAVLSASCRFGSVSALTTSVEASTEHAEAVALGEPLCRLRTALLSETPDCDDQAERIEAMQTGLSQLAAYGSRIDALAAQKAVDVSVAAHGVVALGETMSRGALKGLERKAIVTSTQILTKVITTAIKQRAIRRALVEADGATQCLAWRGITAVEVWRRDVATIAEAGTKADALDIALDPSMQPPPSEPPPASEPDAGSADPDPVTARVGAMEQEAARVRRRVDKSERRGLESERLALRSAQVLAADHDRRLAALERALWATALAHNHLACHRETVGTTRDRQLRREVDARILCVLERDLPPKQRTAACRPVLEHAQRLRDGACAQLYELDERGEPRKDKEGAPIPTPPVCPEQASGDGSSSATDALESAADAAGQALDAAEAADEAAESVSDVTEPDSDTSPEPDPEPAEEPVP